MPSSRSLQALFVHPVKSCHPVPVTDAQVQRAGLDGDRRWMLIDGHGRFQTQRRMPGLARLHVRSDGDALLLGLDGEHALRVEAPLACVERIQVRIWNDTVAARPASTATHAWLSQAMGSDLRLVHIDSDTTRRIDPDFSQQDEYVSLADGFPILVATTASLKDLSGRVGEPLDMRRFRPNLVIDTEVPWEEDGWATLLVGEVKLRIAKPCGRCIMTTLDPDTGAAADAGGVLQTLKGFRRAANGDVIFGQNAIPMNTGHIRVGDAVTVLESASV